MAALSLPAWAEELPGATVPDAEQLEAEGAIVGDVILDRRNIFDLSNPEENKPIYRWANRMHVVTRASVIESQLLLRRGDKYSSRLIEESVRILRANRFIIEAKIEPVKYENGVVDLKVTTKDVWTLTPDFTFSRSGGENSFSVGIEETNLLGRGQLLRIKWVDDVDRTSTRLEFEDRNLGQTWWRTFVRFADNSDGDTRFVSLVRPFHALDARWSAGGWLLTDDRRTALYRLGDEAAEFRRKRDYYSAFGGWSRGLQNGWVRRWSAGVAYDNNRFSEARDPSLPAVIPEDRKLVYPFLQLEILEDDFDTSSNTNQIGRTEDFYMGTRLSASLGWSDTSFDADRDALVFSATASTSFGSLEKTALLLDLRGAGRRESGETKNATTTLGARFYHRQSEKRLFFLAVSGTAGHDLDLDNPVQVGGKSGLRGYPLRYQTGDSRMTFTVEQRYFTDWYPWRLFRVGGAVFFDIGRTWGENPIGEEHHGWLKDIGFGLRLAPTRFSTNKVAHIDFAFPLDGDSSIDDFQVLVSAKRSF